LPKQAHLNTKNPFFGTFLYSIEQDADPAKEQYYQNRHTSEYAFQQEKASSSTN
jgi:hypothetical protein